MSQETGVESYVRNQRLPINPFVLPAYDEQTIILKQMLSRRASISTQLFYSGNNGSNPVISNLSKPQNILHIIESVWFAL